MSNSGQGEFGPGGRLDSGRQLFRAVEFDLGSRRESTEPKRNSRTAAEGSDVAQVTSPKANLPPIQDDCHGSLSEPPVCTPGVPRDEEDPAFARITHQRRAAAGPPAPP